MLDSKVGRGSTPRLRIPCPGGYRCSDENAGLCTARSRGVTGVSFTQTENQVFALQQTKAISLMQTRSKDLELTRLVGLVFDVHKSPPNAALTGYSSGTRQVVG